MLTLEFDIWTVAEEKQNEKIIRNATVLKKNK